MLKNNVQTIRVLIFPWGNPWKNPEAKDEKERYSWKKVRYEFADVKRDSYNIHEQDQDNYNRTTLPCFLKRFCDLSNNTIRCTCIILILDTVYSLLVGEDVKKSYSEIVNIIREKCKEFLVKEALKGQKEMSEYWSKAIRIIVGPGAGEYRNENKHIELQVVGKLSDYYHYVLYELSREIWEVLKEVNNPQETTVEIVLDIAHGINYILLMTYKALREISEILSLGGYHVVLKVYESEPVTPATPEGSRIKIHLIENLEPKFNSEIIKRIKRPFIAIYDALESSDENKLNSIKEDMDEEDEKIINGFLSALKNCLPLALKLTSFDPKMVEASLRAVVKEFYDKVKVTIERKRLSNSNNEIMVLTLNRSAYLTENFASLVHVYLIRSALSKAFPLKSSNEATLTELEEILKNCFKKWHPAFQWIKVELEKLKKPKEKCIKEGSLGLLSNLSNLWVPLGFVLERKLASNKNKNSKCGTSKSKGNFEKNLRNFVAHAGLLKDLTEAHIYRITSKNERKYLLEVDKLRYPCKTEVLEYLQALL